MYSNCLFCLHPLGGNSIVKAFPVGERLAFDQAQGRLWAICKACGRWNLTPIETRWEAIEECERLFRGTRTRIATDHIGLAGFRDGMELVRIGEPLRPELAAWRYGDKLLRRRRRRILLASASVVAAGAYAATGLVAGVSVLVVGWTLARAGSAALHGRPSAVIALTLLPSGQVARIRRGDLARTRLFLDSRGQVALEVAYEGGASSLSGASAMGVASVLFPHVNRYGASRTLILDAVAALERRVTAEGYLTSVARVSTSASRVDSDAVSWNSVGSQTHGLFALSPVQRLATEMALHESSERRALEGDLSQLEQRWREAEEVAAIADNLLVPRSVTEALQRFRHSL